MLNIVDVVLSPPPPSPPHCEAAPKPTKKNPVHVADDPLKPPLPRNRDVGSGTFLPLPLPACLPTTTCLPCSPTIALSTRQRMATWQQQDDDGGDRTMTTGQDDDDDGRGKMMMARGKTTTARGKTTMTAAGVKGAPALAPRPCLRLLPCPVALCLALLPLVRPSLTPRSPTSSLSCPSSVHPWHPSSTPHPSLVNPSSTPHSPLTRPRPSPTLPLAHLPFRPLALPPTCPSAHSPTSPSPSCPLAVTLSPFRHHCCRLPSPFALHPRRLPPAQHLPLAAQAEGGARGSMRRGEHEHPKNPHKHPKRPNEHPKGQRGQKGAPRGPTWKQILVSCGGTPPDLTKFFTELAVTSIVCAYDSLSLVTPAIASQSDLDILRNFICESLPTSTPFAVALPSSTSFIKILDVPYFDLKGLKITQEALEKALHTSVHAEVFAYLSTKPRIDRNSAHSTSCTVYCNIWDSQQGTRAKKALVS
ncbi:unnamed protein product [Cyclocybe aegerita]|uniref:Uncharacterized protein n=1 Tax=Cyclocybe aegerita TaxID=1973307 RepID=A0A8S0WPM8_CYCAE|nr:unnamed protein product [Cyclocybe aegerita]